MKVHTQLGMGFKEAVYKDALKLGFRQNDILYLREKKFDVEYKGIILSHKYFADFVMFDQIILELKSSSFIVNNFVAQTIHYLKASGMKLGIIVNFGERSLTYKRIVF